MRKSFISYRQERGLEVRAFCEKLKNKFGRDNMFLDVDRKVPGEKWWPITERELRDSDAVFVMIDDEWLVDKQGHRRLDDKDNWVRREIEIALTEQIPIFPVLIEDATMPKADDLPESLRDLAEFQGIRLRNEEFTHDVDKILAEVEKRAELQRQAEIALEDVRDYWDQGNWQQTHKRLVERSAGSGEQRGGRLLPRGFSRRLDILQRLTRAAEAFGQRRFDAARDLLAKVPLAEAPRNVGWSLKLAAIGATAAAASAAGQIDALTAAEQEYANVKHEVSVQGLEIVPGLDEVGNFFSDEKLNIRYREAVESYQRGRYLQARTRLSQLKGYQYSANMLAACDLWIDFFPALGKRDWNQAKSLLTALSRVGDPAMVRRWRRWYNVLPRCIDALEELGDGPALIDRDVPCEGGECPYAVLGLAPSADGQTIKKFSFELQAKAGGMPTRERNAWDFLRLPDRRLLADFGIYSVADCKRAKQLTNPLLNVNPDAAADHALSASPDNSSRSLVLRIGERLDEDAALFFRLMKMHEAALDALERTARTAPQNPGLLHHIGLVAASRIYAETEGSDLSAFWNRVIYGFGATFADDRFWHQWWAGRQDIYRVTRDQVSQARDKIQRYWLDEARLAGEARHDYALLLQQEINGAYAVRAGGGIPLEGGARTVVGPKGAAVLGLHAQIADWVRGFDADSLSKEGWQKRVRLYFSDLGTVATLADLGRHREVLASIVALKDAVQGDFAERNPGFAHLPNPEICLRRMLSEFEEQAHYNVGIDWINEAPPRVPEATAAWQAALALADQRGERDEMSLQLQKVAVARAGRLRSDEKTVEKFERLNNAVDFLEAVRDAGLGGEVIADALVQALLDRAVCMFNEHIDFAAARNSARRAWTMAPSTPRALTTLYSATIRLAGDMRAAGRLKLMRTLLDEADDLYHDGVEKFPGYPVLEEWKKIRDEEFGDAYAIDKPEEAWKNLEEVLNNNALDEASNSYAEALNRESSKDYSGAIAILKQLLQHNPDDQHIKAKLAIDYQQWVAHLTEQKAPQEELKRIALQALDSCPDSDLLGELRQFASGGKA
jgi:hypothetical protein